MILFEEYIQKWDLDIAVKRFALKLYLNFLYYIVIRKDIKL